jgi:tetratricopeptide (TPR) repeat protein
MMMNRWQVQSLNQKGIALEDVGKIDEAIATFSKALAIDEDDTAYYWRAFCYMTHKKDYRRAIEDYTQAIRIQEELWPTIVKKVKQGRGPGDVIPETYCFRSHCYEEVGQYKLALNDLEMALKRYPSKFLETKLRQNKANLLTFKLNSKPEMANAEINIAAKSETDENELAKLYFSEALNHMTLHNFEKVIEAATKSLKFDPHNQLNYLNRAQAYYSIGELDKALADVKHASNYLQNEATDPEKAGVYNLVARIYMKKCQWDKALIEINKAIRLSTNKGDRGEYSKYLVNRAAIYNGMRELEMSLDDLNTAIHLAPKYAIAYKARGQLYKQLQQFDEAIKDFTSCLKYSANQDATAYYERAAVYASSGNHDKAIEDCNSGLKLVPNDPKFQELLSTIQMAHLTGVKLNAPPTDPNVFDTPIFAPISDTLALPHDTHRCFHCKRVSTEKMKRCSACRSAFYCSVACQKKDWPSHKKKCKSNEE